MSEYPLQKFIDLIEYDQTILSLEKQLEEVQYAIDVANNQIKSCQESVDNMKVTKHAFKKEVDAKELEMKILDTQEREKKVKLDQTENYQDYQLIQSEINALKKSQAKREEDLIAVWKNLESFDQTYQQKKTYCQAEKESLDTSIADQMKTAEALKKNIDEHMKRRLEKEQGIPTEWLDRYATMRSKVSNPVVPLEHESCTACFYRVPQRDLIDLRKGKLLVCKDCFRFLYIRPPIT